MTQAFFLRERDYNIYSKWRNSEIWQLKYKDTGATDDLITAEN